MEFNRIDNKSYRNSSKLMNDFEILPRRFWIKENLSRYEYFSKLSHGKILDCKFNNSSSFTSAKILLEQNANEVITYHEPTNEFCKRILKNKKIHFQNIQNKTIEIKNFDYIFSFETTFEKLDLENTIKKFLNLLNNDGYLILSIINKNKLDKNYLGKKFQNILFTKDEFYTILEKYFKNIQFYSQMINEEKQIPVIDSPLSSIRKSTGKILSRIDKNKKFYLKYIQKNINKVDKKNLESLKISKNDCQPVPFMNEHDSFYIIAVCKKS